MRLSELLGEQDMNVQALKDVDIAGLTADSRAVQPGFLFAALPGVANDGRAFIGDAIGRGAAAVLAAPGTGLATGTPIRLITDSNPRRRFALMAAQFFGAQPKTIAAVTGTNGKTSVAHFTRQLWTTLGRNAGYLGTLGADAPCLHIDGALTTLDPVRLHTVLADMAGRGVTHLAMEASSHGLHQFRIDGVKIALAGFTNVTRDHLDYHGSMVAYMAAKLRLFSEVMTDDGTAVINADSPDAAAFESAARPRGIRVMTYGKAGTDIRLNAARIDGDAQVLELAVLDKTYTARLPLAGRFQTSNALCALGFALADGTAADKAVAALEKLSGVPGRLEHVATHPNGAPIYVDYAHSPDALETVLKALRPHAAGNLAVVFGCGGDRDRGKRRLMGERAQVLADVVYVTDDNPRSEVAASIRSEIMQGAPGAKNIGDRTEAITIAINALQPGDVLLIAGKGHETGQIIGTKVIPHNDADVARQVLKGVRS